MPGITHDLGQRMVEKGLLQRGGARGPELVDGPEIS
jgi:hypothetical protein